MPKSAIGLRFRNFCRKNNLDSSKRPLLICLPGLDGTGLLFRDFVERAAAYAEPLVIHYSGERVQSYEELCGEIEAQITVQVPGERPFALLGESYSGPLAIMIAARLPERTTALVLVGSFAAAPYSRFICGLARIANTVLSPLIIPFYLAGHAVLRFFGIRQLSGLQKHPVAEVKSFVFSNRIRSILAG